ncbi:centrosomal protein of 104 kDa-like [Gigantopelta aegis]|uniref:centrosomal protein of 104 kDa-like n=1 Tax=Gigantopelta aegis TaxID=1735272 RepID=UPI001B88C7BD|nr:centrosomal protein of 104 kDa-like [Gigantopelta aegis]
MPVKIPFRVVHASGQDDSYRAAELNNHSPLTKGWSSARYCLYPQDIVIQLDQRTRIRKIQLLSHQFLIATKIEFFVGDVPDLTPLSLDNVRYTRLGYVSLSDNEKTGYKARELKSVHVDAVGLFLKLNIHKNHINRHNLYNQVGIVAINVIGDRLGYGTDVTDPDFFVDVSDKRNLEKDPILDGFLNRPDYISPLDDLAFDMYQDPEIAQIIRKLEKKKQEAVMMEKYDYAKQLKQAISELQKNISDIFVVSHELPSNMINSVTALNQSAAHIFLQQSLQDDEARAYSLTNVPIEKEITPKEPYWLPVRSVRQSILDEPYLLPSENQYFLPPDKKKYFRARKNMRPYRSLDDFEPRPDSRSSDEPYWVPVNSPYFRRYEDLLRGPDVRLLAHLNRATSALDVPESDEPTISRRWESHRRKLDPIDVALSDTDSLRIKMELTSSTVGEKLGKMEVEKRQAVENEDYDKAKTKKLQMDEYRNQAYRDLRIAELLEASAAREQQALDYSYRQRISPRMLEVYPTPPQSPPRYDERPLPTARRNSQVNDNPPKPDPDVKEAKEGTPYEERQLPIHKPAPILDELDLPETTDSDAIEEVEPMTEKDLRDASSAIDIFGQPLVSKAYSKTWSFREDSLLAVYKQLEMLPTSVSKDEAKSMFRAAVFLVKRAIDDKVYAVFKAALHLLKMMLRDFVPKHRLPKQEVTYAVEKTIPNLLHKSGDTAIRNRDDAKKTIFEIAKLPEVKPTNAVLHECIKPIKVSMAPRLAESHCEIVEQLYSDHGLSNNTYPCPRKWLLEYAQTSSDDDSYTAGCSSMLELTPRIKWVQGSPSLTVPTGFYAIPRRFYHKSCGLTLDNLMTFCVEALHHNAGEVREVSERIIKQLYLDVGAPVREYLPHDDDKTRKITLWRQLFEYFDRIDGKPTKQELQKKKATQEAKKQAEIEALQKQLQQLKDIQQGKLLALNKPVDDSLLKKKGSPQKKGKLKPKGPPAKDDDDLSVSNMDKICIFCGERNNDFNDEGLDLHYWKSCPVLKRCANCKEVVEIASLTDHLLKECESKNNFSKCPRCSEAIVKAVYDQHVAEKTCNPNQANVNHCPLCHENIPVGEDSWKNHLMGPRGCSNNPRRLLALNKPAGTSIFMSYGEPAPLAHLDLLTTAGEIEISRLMSCQSTSCTLYTVHSPIHISRHFAHDTRRKRKPFAPAGKGKTTTRLKAAKR